ncbi:MAG: filamentous hemagglutinin N-terminal domain-containing protein, partial [Alphaproteobacteria bacterium]|nr:filamentous hemagglutinin N-terminal domain-containing protein [Alphaproteobacteria bacterium]
MARVFFLTALSGFMAGLPCVAVAMTDTLPTGAQLMAGTAIVSSAGSIMTVNQSTPKAAINWNSFSIGSGAKVNFVQPSSSALTLNRVVGNEKSIIEGALNANGHVFLLNSNGVLFTNGATVNAGGVVASTMGLSDDQFMAGKYQFSNNGSTAYVINQGAITAADWGYVALLGQQVSNQGIISARLGGVALAGGEKVSLNLNGDSLINVTVDEAAVHALVENKQAIYADGGQVIMTAKAADALLDKVVNNEGIIQARSISSHNGVIRLEGGSHGTVSVSGTLDVSGTAVGESGGDINVRGSNILMDAGSSVLANGGLTGNGGRISSIADNVGLYYGDISAQGGALSGDGGFVETSGLNDLDITGSVSASAANGLAGMWLLDPASINIGSATDGNVTGNPNFTATGTAAKIKNTTIKTALDAGTNVTVTTTGDAFAGTGDITISKGFTTTGSGSLTLNSYNDIFVNDPVVMSTGAFTATAARDVSIGASGSVASSKTSGTAISLGAGRNFINNKGSTALSDTAGGRWLVYSTTPGADTFGSLDSGHTAIWNKANGATIGLGLGNRYVFSFQPTVTFTATGTLGKTYGDDAASAVAASSYTVSGVQAGVANAFTADSNATAFSGAPSLTSTGSATTANVNLGPYAISAGVGTLAALNGYALGYASTGTLTVSPALLTYTADAAGRTYGASNPSFTGTISGFVLGQNQASATTGTMSFGTTATASSNVASYAIDGSGLTANNGNYTFAQAAANATALTINPALLTYTADAAERAYGASNPSFTGTISGFVLGQNQASATTGTMSFGTTATASSNVASYAIDGSGLTAKDGNYTFAQAAANATALTINPALLTYTANAAERTYGASNPGFSGAISGFVLGQDQASATTGTMSFGTTATASSNVGSYAIDGSGLTAKNGNYTFAQAAANATALTINPALLTYTADAAERAYGASNPSFSGAISGFVLGQNQASATTGAMSFGTTATASSNVASYAIDGSGLTANNGNYTFAQAAVNATALTVNQRPITVTADAGQHKTYGDADPASYTYDITSGSLVGTDAFSGALDRVTGENAGSYDINKGTLSLGGNYDLAYFGDHFAIDQRHVTVTADAGQHK